MLPLAEGRRVALVDDVISSGASIPASGIAKVPTMRIERSARATPGRLRGWKFNRDEANERA